ncbi:unnamed protein product [Prorocentrum cordatum]|uniref:Uncharacterized protein n=1 Tax=Prorocentrum cordatum TaxID=2364126 RepID=A0ABN9RK32_9DINO|nr:unnamed protein product [Polarella glacialis]
MLADFPAVAATSPLGFTSLGGVAMSALRHAPLLVLVVLQLQLQGASGETEGESRAKPNCSKALGFNDTAGARDRSRQDRLGLCGLPQEDMLREQPRARGVGALRRVRPRRFWQVRPAHAARALLAVRRRRGRGSEGGAEPDCPMPQLLPAMVPVLPRGLLRARELRDATDGLPAR